MNNYTNHCIKDEVRREFVLLLYHEIDPMIAYHLLLSLMPVLANPATCSSLLSLFQPSPLASVPPVPYEQKYQDRNANRSIKIRGL